MLGPEELEVILATEIPKLAGEGRYGDLRYAVHVFQVVDPGADTLFPFLY